MAAEKKPKSGRRVDLRVARAARAEAQQDPVTITVTDDLDLTLPPELPAAYILELEAGHLGGALRGLLGDQADAFFASASMADLEELVKAINEVYAVTAGEAEASQDS
ncbi:MAG: hypothetical protein Q8O56_06180 [Solirubrobacteraceae bacterium]|nr:hypothetical protein [Solirubrobacteraceae bacterium]